MSHSFLYQAFGIRGDRYRKTGYEGGMVLFYADANDDHCRCAACGSDIEIRRGTTRRWFRSLPIGGRLTWLITDVPRIGCRNCHVVRQIELGFAAPRRTYTKRFTQYALELARTMTIKDVAAHLGVSWDGIKDLKKAYLRAMNSGVRHLQEMARTLLGHAHGILAYYEHPICTGPSSESTTELKLSNDKPTVSETKITSNYHSTLSIE